MEPAADLVVDPSRAHPVQREDDARNRPLVLLERSSAEQNLERHRARKLGARTEAAVDVVFNNRASATSFSRSCARGGRGRRVYAAPPARLADRSTLRDGEGDLVGLRVDLAARRARNASAIAARIFGKLSGIPYLSFGGKYVPPKNGF